MTQYVVNYMTIKVKAISSSFEVSIITIDCLVDLLEQMTFFLDYFLKPSKSCKVSLGTK